MALITCDHCWQCCAPCAMKCTHDDRSERARHPDASWTCNRLLRDVDHQDAIIHAFKLLEERMGAGVPDGGKMPEGWNFVRALADEMGWR